MIPLPLSDISNTIGDGVVHVVDDDIKNPIVICTKELGYIQDAFLQHMKKFVQDEGNLETTQLVGYTKGCETEQAVI